MKSSEKSKKLRMPILDCLLDDNPSNNREEPHPSSVPLEQLRECLRRDLENLFNTRQCCLSPPENSCELSVSLLNYGLPDPATLNLNSTRGIDDLCKRMEVTICAFEPRIKSVNVKPVSSRPTEDSSFRFRVEAELHASPAHETIVFDSSLDPVSRSVHVKAQL